MPDAPTRAASKNSNSNLFPRGIILTIYGTQKGSNPGGSFSVEVGSYPWDSTLTLEHPSDPVSTIIQPNARGSENAQKLTVLFSLFLSIGALAQL